jgi:hypothetical protein
MELLERLLTSAPSSERDRLAYLVTLLLLRRKVLRLRGSQDGQMRVSRVGEQRQFRVREVEIAPEALREMDEDLATLMALDQAAAAPEGAENT